MEVYFLHICESWESPIRYSTYKNGDKMCALNILEMIGTKITKSLNIR